MPRPLARAASLAVVAAASLLLLACATTQPNRAGVAHAGVDLKGKRCTDCHPDGVKKGRARGGATGAAQRPAPAPSYDQNQ